jgi:hypothetical protein
VTPATPPQDAVAVHRGLLSVARDRKADFNAILVQYAIERLIDRLSRSIEARRFVLKGAMLFRVWTGELHRPTKDVDFLGHGEATPSAVAESVRRICAVEVGDGLRFDLDSIATEEIREEQDYGGVRVAVVAYLAHVPITVRIDVGFGDAVTPEASQQSFPTLLGHPAASILIYPPETVVAEKMEAMCKLGLINSRMKDYADIIAISRRFEIGGDVLAQAFRATFERRGMRLPTDVPIGLSREFGADAEKESQWIGFLKRMRIVDMPASLAEAVASVEAFTLPALHAAAGVRPSPGRWVPGVGWRSTR